MFKSLSILLVAGFQHCFAASTPILTASFDEQKKSVAIRWTSEQLGISTFVIQRSDNSRNWTDIALQQVNNNAVNRPYYFNDNKPPAGENFYRLKLIKTDGEIEYSGTVMVIISSAVTGANWVMYPVPVTDVLTLQYRGQEPIKGVINVFIQTMGGNILCRIRSASSNRQIKIPVDNLGKGIYDIRIIIENEIVWNQRFVK